MHRRRHQPRLANSGPWRRTAVVTVTATVSVIVVMDWVPMVLNQNILLTSPRERLPGTLIHAGAGATAVIANLLGRRWLMLGGAVWFTIVLVSALLNWWVPYVFAVYPGEISQETFAREYADNLRVLPTIRRHPVVPDVQHTMIHLGVLLSSVFSWLAFRRAGRA